MVCSMGWDALSLSRLRGLTAGRIQLHRPDICLGTRLPTSHLPLPKQRKTIRATTVSSIRENVLRLQPFWAIPENNGGMPLQANSRNAHQLWFECSCCMSLIEFRLPTRAEYGKTTVLGVWHGQE